MSSRSLLIVCVALVLVFAACGSKDTSAPLTTTTSTAATTTQPATITTTSTSTTSTTATPTTTTATSTSSAPTTLPEPPDERAVEALAWGLFCRDLVATGWDYVEAVAYWNVEGRPARMDADENGIPCETVYTASDVMAYWGEPLPTGLAPGPGSGWSTSTREAPVTPACCSMNHNGPESPPLPPASGAFPDDGAFSVRVEREEGRTDRLEVEVRRWLPCSEQPDQCSPDLFPGDVYEDPENAVVRTVSLADELIVVIRPIGRDVDGTWTESPSIEGDGAALASLLRRLDAAVTTFAAPAHEAGNFDFLATGTADPTFPYGPAEEGWILAYRGPEDSYLTPGFNAILEWDEPSWMYGWWCTIEIVGGTPILYIWAGQIAG